MAEIYEISDTDFCYHSSVESKLQDLQKRVISMREVGKLSPQVLRRIQQYFRIKGIYHSNAIEGNSLTIGETKMVVEMGLTISGKTLRDQAEAKNLSHALDFMEELATNKDKPITLSDIRQIHSLILNEIDDDNAGRWRTTDVRISGSKYIPPEPPYLDSKMHDLANWLQEITSTGFIASHTPLALAAAAHAWLAQVHPFVDGNGRTCRILMNLILMRAGYPICIITHEDRLRYYEALEESQSSDLTPLIELMYENTVEGLEEWEKAAEEQRIHDEWLAGITAKFAEPALNKAKNEYELWSNAMDLLRSYFKQTIDDWNDKVHGGAHVYFRDFGMLGFDKYLSIRDGESAKRTWFFRIDFTSGIRRARYLFFFGYGELAIRRVSPVVLIVAKETQPYFYERLQEITAENIPDIRQIGFDIKGESFVATTVASGLLRGKIEGIGRTFLEQVVTRDFGG